MVQEAVAIKIATEVILLAKEQGWFEHLANAIRRRQPHRVLLLGSTGVGKTMLRTSLKELVPTVIHFMDRTEFTVRDRLTIEAQPFEFIDTPGQRQDRRMQAIIEAARKGVDGVLDVVCYGYHEGKLGKEDAFTASGRISQAYLKQRREVEIAHMLQWAYILSSAGSKPWIMTIVTKADHWWNRQSKVMAHYGSGQYAVKFKDATGSDPAALVYSSTSEPFCEKVPGPGSFSQSARTRTRNHLIKSLMSAIGKPA